jgi:hypothetical protein
LRVRADQTYGHVSVKLCDVAPDGTSTLITRGMLDLRQRNCWPAAHRGVVGAEPQPLTPSEWVDIEIEFEATTWTLQPGRTLRLAVAGTDWPNCWPPPGPVVLDVDAAATVLDLPLVDDLPESAHEFARGRGPSDDEADGVVWRTGHDVLARETTVITRYGGTYDGEHGAVVTDDYRGELGVSTVDPAIAWARGTSSFEITWGDVGVRTEATLDIRSDHRRFEVELTLAVHDGETRIADRSWSRTIPR